MASCSKVHKKSSKSTEPTLEPTYKSISNKSISEISTNSNMVYFQESTCGELIKSATNASRSELEKLLPNKGFYKFIKMNSAPSDDIMLIDTEKHGWKMMVNQAVALKKAGSKLIVLAVAHDSETCHNTVSMGVPCFHDHPWYRRIVNTYESWDSSALPPGYKLHLVMLIRMMTTMVALCEGRNVFLSDSDVLFYRDPMDYVFKDVNIMVSATAIDFERWSGFFFSDQPKQGQTLNNGVVYYRNNELTKAFLLTLAAHSIRALITNHGDPDSGFLQTAFNMDLNSAKLIVHPSRYISLG